MSGHSTRTAVVTSRLAFADIAHLHQTAERTATTVSALVAQIVHEHARHLADEDHPQTTDDASSISKQGVRGESEVADLPVVDRGGTVSLPEPVSRKVDAIGTGR